MLLAFFTDVSPIVFVLAAAVVGLVLQQIKGKGAVKK